MIPFIALNHEPDGYHAVCDSIDCGNREPEYRVILGTYTRFFCERCMTNLLLEPVSA